MAQRLDLQALLVELLESPNVYFQPPESIVMKYPCIVYHRSNIRTRFADNVPYKHLTRYLLEVISDDPDNEIVDKVKALPMCSYDRFFTTDHLNHDVFTLFF